MCSIFTCTKCCVTKNLDQFHKRTALKRGHDSWCKDCKAIYRKQYFKANYHKETTRSRIKAWKYLGVDISYEEYQKRVLHLNGKCELCSNDTQTLHVDHCHKTGQVRGLLCGSCNRGLGLFKDSKDVLKEAINYLSKYE